MFDKAARVAAIVIALSQATAAKAFACDATAPKDDLMGLVSLGAIGAGILVTGIALTLRPPKKPHPATPEDGSTTTLPAS